ncbi:hypothetical protein AAG570_012069, partial [Ranatra chinensis]
FLGKKVDGIWHTGIVVYGKEYYFGSGGIGICNPGSLLGEPLQKVTLGRTHIPFPIFDDFINGLNESEFCGESYNLIKHNCNNFSDEVSQFLVGTGIPSYILNLPEEIINTPFGQTFRGLIDQVSKNSPTFGRNRADSPEFRQLNSEIEAVRRHSLALDEKRNALNEKLARRERKKNKKRKKEIERSVDLEMSSNEVTGEVSTEREASGNIADEFADEEKREREERRRNREPPIVFKDAVDIHIEFDSLVGLIDGKLNEEEQQSLEELHQYMLQDEGSWALGDGFLNFIGRLLTDKSLGDEVSVRCLNVLAAAALKDDVVLMLHQDRRQHILMNYAFEVDRLPLPQQRSLTLFMCNLFENGSSSEWMLYISEWQYNNAMISNIRVTTKVAVNAILSDDADLRDRGTAILYNLATKEVFDDVAVELTMAVLQFLGGSPSEAQVFRCLKSLGKFCQISAQDVPQLIMMIGPHPSKFKGQSERNDKLIDEISSRLK